MQHKLGRRTAAVAGLVCAGVLGQTVLAGAAGAVTVTKADLKGGQLRVEGQGAFSSFVSIESTTSAVGARPDVSGRFKAQASNFTAPDCKLTVSDGRTPTATVTITGCTPSAVAVPPVPAPPTGSCVITSQPAVTLTANAMSVVNFETTGCNTTFNSGATPTPVQWTVVAGVIPTGMVGPHSQGTTAGNIIGTPSVPGTYRFTLQVTDQVGASDQENVTVDVV
jgi:hypothetical protein